MVDDEENIAFLVDAALRLEGIDTQRVGNGYDAITAVESFQPHAIVLDVMMPGIDGFEVVRRLRNDGVRTPVLFLTARSAVEDRVHGLTLGGDDYLVKPFAIAELVARVQVALRRNDELGSSRVLRVADLELDQDAYRVSRGGHVVTLSPTEYKLLRYLMSNTGRVLSRAQILDHVWNYDFDGDASVVETYVSYLRRKLDQTSPKLIHTVRGVGYCVRVDG